MMFGPGYLEPAIPMVGSLSPWSRLFTMASQSQIASGTFESANRGLWYPLDVPTTCVARRMWWANGATVSATYNIEAGIYLDAGSKPGAKLVTTGSVAQGTASQVQLADITATVLTPGLYWIYISCSSLSSTLFRSSLHATYDELLRFQQDSIGPGSAPATATPAESNSSSMWMFGFSTRAVTAPTVHATTVSSSSNTFTPDAGWADGSVMVAIAGSTSATPSLPSGWTDLGTPSDTWDDGGGDSGTHYTRMAYVVKDSGSDVTFTNAGWIRVIDLEGVWATAPLEGYTSSNSSTVGELATVCDNSLLVYAALSRPTSWTPASGMTEVVDSATNVGGARVSIDVMVTGPTGQSGTRSATQNSPAPDSDELAISFTSAFRGIPSP